MGRGQVFIFTVEYEQGLNGFTISIRNMKRVLVNFAFFRMKYELGLPSF